MPYAIYVYFYPLKVGKCYYVLKSDHVGFARSKQTGPVFTHLTPTKVGPPPLKNARNLKTRKIAPEAKIRYVQGGFCADMFYAVKAGNCFYRLKTEHGAQENYESLAI